jgi:hypothetical protein
MSDRDRLNTGHNTRTYAPTPKGGQYVENYAAYLARGNDEAARLPRKILTSWVYC